MEESILDRIRLIKEKIQNLSWTSADNTVIAQGFSNALACNTYLWTIHGRLIGSFTRHAPCQVARNTFKKQGYLPGPLRNYFSDLQEADGNQEAGHCLLQADDSECTHCERTYTLIPMIWSGKQLGTVVLTRYGEPFTNQDLWLAECCTVLLSTAIGYHSQCVGRHRSAIKQALNSLSFAERKAMDALLSEMTNEVAVFKASQLAEKYDLSKSTFSTGIRKLASAGLIQSRSLGTRGTYLKILDRRIFEEIRGTYS